MDDLGVLPFVETTIWDLAIELAGGASHLLVNNHKSSDQPPQKKEQKCMSYEPPAIPAKIKKHTVHPTNCRIDT